MFMGKYRVIFSIFWLNAAIGFGFVNIGYGQNPVVLNSEHPLLKEARNNVMAAILAPYGNRQEVIDAEASLTALGWLMLYGNGTESAQFSRQMAGIVTNYYNGTDKLQKIYQNHTVMAYSKMLNLSSYQGLNPDNPSDEYAKIVGDRVGSLFSPGAGASHIRMAEASLMAFGWMTVFGNDATSATLANLMRNKAQREWRGENEIYKIQTQEAYRELMNLGIYRMNEGHNSQLRSTNPVENDFWDSVKTSSRGADFQLYLDNYSLSTFDSIARVKLFLCNLDSQIPQGILTDIQYLNSRAKLFNHGQDFEAQFNEAKSLCPEGCDEVDNETYLRLSFDARWGGERNSSMADLEKQYKPKLLEEYCRTESVRRNLWWRISFEAKSRADGQPGNFDLFPSDCAAGTSEKTNIALGKTATQSSDSYPGSQVGLASNAIDNNPDGDLSRGSVTYALCNSDRTRERTANIFAFGNCPWWEVDLGENHNITEIQIWNRTDSGSEQLNSFRIWTRSANGSEEEFTPGLQYYTPGEQYPLIFTGNKVARYIRIEIVNPKGGQAKDGILSLAEVKVFGTN